MKLPARFLLGCVSASAMVALGGGASAQQPSLPKHDPGTTRIVPATVLATWPEMTFLESIAALPDGTLLIANKEGARIERYTTSGARELLARLPEGVTGIELGANGEVFATGRIKDKPETVYRIDASGKVEEFAVVLGAKFLNGLARISPTTLLIADSGARTIWKVDLTSRAVTPWLVHDLLGHRDPAHQFPGNTFIPGANGIKRFRNAIYVSSTDRGLVLRIALRSDGSADEPTVWVRDIVVDDFAFDVDGNLYGTSHPLSTVFVLRRDGSRTTLATGEQGVVGATAVAFGTRPGDEGSLYVVGNSRIKYQQANHPGRLVRLDIGVPGYARYQFTGDGAAVRQVGRVEAFMVTAQSNPGTEEQRRATAPAYLAYMEQNFDRIVLGGQLMDKPGGSVVSRFYLLRAGDAAAAKALIEQSPYFKAGVYGNVEARPATGMLGELMGGVAWVPGPR